MARSNQRGKAAYFLVDLSDLPDESRQDIMEDALAGGGEFGLRVVEEVHNGPARQSIFGVYYVDQDKWEAAKAEFGISSKTIDDSEVPSVEGTDPRAEAAIRQKAEEEALAEADRVRTAEANEVAKIAGEDKPVNKNKR